MRDADNSNIFTFALITPTRSYSLYVERLEDLTLWVKSIAAVRKGEIKTPRDFPKIGAAQFRPHYHFEPGMPKTSPRETVESPRSIPAGPPPRNTEKPSSSQPEVSNADRLLPNVYKCEKPSERSWGSFNQRNMQMTCFIRWVQSRIAKVAPTMKFTDLKQLADGLLLVSLAESLTGSKPQDIVQSPSNSREVMDNCSKAIKAISERLKVAIPSIPIPLVMSGNMKAQLDLIWAIIYATEIQPMRYNGFQDRFAILQWLQDRTSVYQNVNITDFTSGFGNGIALLALVLSQKPSIVDFSSLVEYKALDNIKDALQWNEEHFGVPKLFDPSDLTETPDETAMIVYFAECFRCFENS
jgi:hypothetical protein